MTWRYFFVFSEYFFIHSFFSETLNPKTNFKWRATRWRTKRTTSRTRCTLFTTATTTRRCRRRSRHSRRLLRVEKNHPRKICSRSIPVHSWRHKSLLTLKTPTAPTWAPAASSPAPNTTTGSPSSTTSRRKARARPKLQVSVLWNFLTSSLTKRQNKLDCCSLASLSSLV